MKLKSFGCSFIYGSDLGDCPHGVDADNPPPSKLTWPALLANHYGLEYECHARPAAGNLQILEALLSAISDSDNSLYVINWTWIERFSYTSDSAKTPTYFWNPRGWCSILPTDQTPAAKIYYRDIHSQFRDKLETLICMQTAVDILKDEKIQFMMTYTDDLLLDGQWHTSASILRLQRCIRPYLTDFQNLSYWGWIKQNQFAVSEAWHPLEPAHEAAAELMSPAIDAILHKA